MNTGTMSVFSFWDEIRSFICPGLVVDTFINVLGNILFRSLVVEANSGRFQFHRHVFRVLLFKNPMLDSGEGLGGGVVEGKLLFSFDAKEGVEEVFPLDFVLVLIIHLLEVLDDGFHHF